MLKDRIFIGQCYNRIKRNIKNGWEFYKVKINSYASEYQLWFLFLLFCMQGCGILGTLIDVTFVSTIIIFTMFVYSITSLLAHINISR